MLDWSTASEEVIRNILMHVIGADGETLQLVELPIKAHIAWVSGCHFPPHILLSLPCQSFAIHHPFNKNLVSGRGHFIHTHDGNSIKEGEGGISQTRRPVIMVIQVVLLPCSQFQLPEGEGAIRGQDGQLSSDGPL